MSAISAGQRYYDRRQSTGEGYDEIAAAFGVNYNTVRRAARDYAKSIDAPANRTGRPTVRGKHVRPQFTGLPVSEKVDLHDLIKLARDNQKATESVDPILTTATIPLPVDAPVAIIFVSCAHLGSRYVQHEAFEKYLNEVLKIPRLYWCALGDDTEGFTGFFDVASAHEQALADPKVQRKLLALVLDKLVDAGKLLCGFASQHGSDWMRRRSGEDPIKRLYLERKIPYFDGQAYIKLGVGDQTYKIFGAHQLPGGSMYNKTHAQKRAALFKAPNADVVVQGDKHQYAVQSVSLDTWEYLAGERPSYLQWYVQAGTAKTGPDPYTIKSWSPGVWEWPILVFRHDRHAIAQAADLDLARLMLNQW